MERCRGLDSSAVTCCVRDLIRYFQCNGARMRLGSELLVMIPVFAILYILSALRSRLEVRVGVRSGRCVHTLRRRSRRSLKITRSRRSSTSATSQTGLWSCRRGQTFGYVMREVLASESTATSSGSGGDSSGVDPSGGGGSGGWSVPRRNSTNESNTSDSVPSVELGVAL